MRGIAAAVGSKIRERAEDSGYGFAFVRDHVGLPLPPLPEAISYGSIISYMECVRTSQSLVSSRVASLLGGGSLVWTIPQLAHPSSGIA
jgi:hypothetical protein